MKNSHYLKNIDSLAYDPTNQDSLLTYAEKIRGKSLNQHLQKNFKTNELKKVGNKGELGLLVEELLFHIKNNNDSEPDIPESGIEIKTSQFIYKARAGKSFKERLKLSAINYHEFNNYQSLFETPLWKKIQKILLLMFIHEKEVDKLDQICDWVGFLNYTEEDIEVFAQDWLKIKEYVTSGKANEITESFTSYLAANTAGKNSQDLTAAPGGILAKRRAFSLKTSYLNTLFQLSQSCYLLI
jgi:DNA mismatch repair protein MutH